MIDFGKPFIGGWQIMVTRLFAPFDFGKWLVLGFTLFLASFLDGSNPSLSSVSRFLNPEWLPSTAGLDAGRILEEWREWLGITAAVVGGFLALVALLCWLGAHGQFLLLDNVVHNRGRVAAPWKEFSGSANRLFGFYVLISLASLILLVLEVAGLVGLGWGIAQSGKTDDLNVFLPVLLVGIVVALTWIPIFAFFMLYLEMGIPIIYHQRCGAWAAAGEICRLIRRRPADILVYLLLRLLMGIICFAAFYFIGIFTCCVGFIVMSLPYVSSVLTLPVVLFRLGFTLDCLAQFGPEYDVWSGVNPPELPSDPPPALP